MNSILSPFSHCLIINRFHHTLMLRPLVLMADLELSLRHVPVAPEAETDDWLINVKYPDCFLRRGRVIPSSDDMVVANGLTAGKDLYNLVIYTAAEKLNVGVEEIMSLYDKRHYAASRKPICDLGFYNCCTVEVIARDRWTIFAEVPGGCYYVEECFEVDALSSSSDLNRDALAAASLLMDVPTDDLYALHNGTPLLRSRDVPIYQLGIHDGSTIEVFHKMRGGVCVSSVLCGRKRSVSNRVLAIGRTCVPTSTAVVIMVPFSPNFGRSVTLALTSQGLHIIMLTHIVHSLWLAILAWRTQHHKKRAAIPEGQN